MMVPYLDNTTGMLAREWDPVRLVWGALKFREQPVYRCACGQETTDIYLGEYQGQTFPETLHFEMFPVCPGCEAKRVRLQWEAIAANEAVYPHLRQAAIEALDA